MIGNDYISSTQMIADSLASRNPLVVDNGMHSFQWDDIIRSRSHVNWILKILINATVLRSHF